MIQAYSFGAIKIDGTTYKTDVIVFPNRVNASWWRDTGHQVQEEDLQEVFDFNPELFIIGTGASGLMKPTASLEKKLKDCGIAYIIKKTSDAVEDFNQLIKVKRTVGAFHITC